MKILLVNCVYAFGSTGKIMADLRKGLIDKGDEVRVCYARGATASNVDGLFKLADDWVIKMQSLACKVTGYTYECAPASTNRLKKIVNSWNPDIVNIHCVNASSINIPELITYLKVREIKTVVTHHAEFLFTGGCGHSLNCVKWKTGCDACPQFKKPGSQLPTSYFFDRSKHYWDAMFAAYQGFTNLKSTCVSPWLAARVAESPFFKNVEVSAVYNGLDCKVFHPYNTKRLITAHQLSSENKVVLHVTPNFYSSIKGGKYVLEIAKRLKKEHPLWRLIIVGYNGDGSDFPDNVIPVRFTKNQEELAEYYSLANVTLLTSEKETFSMVCAESLCCGTPVVGFKAGGPESISMKEHSRFVDFGNMNDLYEELVRMINQKKQYPIDINQAVLIYSKESMANNYYNLYHSF